MKKKIKQIKKKKKKKKKNAVLTFMKKLQWHLGGQ